MAAGAIISNQVCPTSRVPSSLLQTVCQSCVQCGHLIYTDSAVGNFEHHVDCTNLARERTQVAFLSVICHRWATGPMSSYPDEYLNAGLNDCYSDSFDNGSQCQPFRSNYERMSSNHPDVRSITLSLLFLVLIKA